MGIEKEETLFLQMPKKILSFSLNETQPALLKRQALFGELGSLIPETRVCFEWLIEKHLILLRAEKVVST